VRTNSPTAVRCGLVGVFAVLAVAFVGPTVSAQFRPGQPGMPNIPRPNFPNIPQPNFPNIPQPNFPPLPQPNFPNMPGMGGFGGIPENIYYCKKCNTELGRGMLPPASATCRCGLTYNNGVAWDNGRPGGVPPLLPPIQPGNPNPNQAPPAQPVNVPKFDIVQLPAVSAETPDQNKPLPPVDLSTPGSPTAPAAAPPPVTLTKSSNRSLLIIGGVVLGLLVVLGMVVAVLYVKANAKKSQPIRRRRADWDEDDD
jgi:hypothetical protein